MRLIDADAFRKRLDEHYPFTKDEQSKHGMADIAKSAVLFVLEKMPTIEPERKRGKWTKENACEFCGFQPWFERDIHTLSFCPNCGADMRGEKDGN